jgi:acetylglutamate kinase
MTLGGVHVVKLGGSLLEDAASRADALAATARSFESGMRLVVVHGGGKRVDAALAALDIPSRTHAGLRITDRPTLDVVVSVLAGIVNKSIVAELTALGIPAIGFSGADGGTLQADVHPPIDGVELGHVGKVTRSDARAIDALLDAGFLPIIASVAAGPDGSLLNVNADSAAAAVALSLHAAALTFLTDVAGFLDDQGNLVGLLHSADVERLLAEGKVTGGMRPKLEAALTAMRGGVARIAIAGPRNHALALSGGNGGTQLVAA